MPDIRQSTVVRDDFNRAGPSLGSNWSTVDTGVWTACEIVSGGGSISEASAGTTSNSRWIGLNAGPFDGDDAECWGCAIGGNAGGAAWGIGLFKDFGSNTADGWRFRNAIAGASDSDYLMEEYINGSRNVRATNTSGDANGPMLMLIRINGADVEGWKTDDLTGATGWNLEVTYPHGGAHTTGLSLCLSASDNSSSQICRWDYFGGGVETWVPQFIRRPWRYKGRQIKPNVP